MWLIVLQLYRMVSRTSKTGKKRAKDNKKEKGSDEEPIKRESDGGRDREDDEKSLFSATSESEKQRQNYGGLLE